MQSFQTKRDQEFKKKTTRKNSAGQKATRQKMEILKQAPQNTSLNWNKEISVPESKLEQSKMFSAFNLRDYESQKNLETVVVSHMGLTSGLHYS